MPRAVNPADVSRALSELLLEDNNLSAQGIALVRSDVINETPSMCPWVGVYRSLVQFQPRTIGAGSGAMNQLIDMLIVAQHSDGTSGEECEERLESLLADICSVVLSDTTVKGTVHALREMSITYDDYRLAGEQFMQTAVVRATYETRVL
ncbi:hypothetical protein UFOVP820_54 [uncultured Caudovirales phage]|uniref:Tail completion protein n=1 Tax=uncultured Caudovirales phage TaxID=2100421 RepID=A0A6J5P0N9_9CAUD|nr:hypothetical protein UFOVP820_54 [uncultured Caudovirales phage]